MPKVNSGINKTLVYSISAGTALAQAEQVEHGAADIAIGSPICCPAVTHVKEKVGENPFSTEMKVSLDWDQWEKLSRKKGAFVYQAEPLMKHRVHEGSATTELIADETKSREDLQMFQRFWPGTVAAFLEKKDSKSEESNQV